MSGLGLVSMDHRVGGVRLIGLVSPPPDRLDGELATLTRSAGLAEVVLLSTCNRMEVYFTSDDVAGSAGRVTVHVVDLARRSGLAVEDEPALRRSLCTRYGGEAAGHLFRVAAGLESMVAGESQVHGQVRQALRTAERAGSAGVGLRALFRAALRTAERSRKRSGLDRADLSVAASAIDEAADRLDGLRGRKALLVGAGRTSRHCGRLLVEAGARTWVTNRSLSTAQEVARGLGGAALPLAEMPRHLHLMDIVVCATAAPHPVLSVDDVAAAVAARSTTLLVADLAVPPDVDEQVARLEGVELITVGSLEAAQAAGAACRSELLEETARLVAEGFDRSAAALGVL